MSPFFYLLFWFIYLASVALALWGAWRLSRSWPFALQQFGRIALAILLLTPAPQAEGSDWLAPAFIALIFDQLQGLSGGWFRAGLYLLIAGSFGLLVYLGSLALHLTARRRRTSASD